MRIPFLGLILPLLTQLAIAQHSGNRVYSNQNHYSEPENGRPQGGKIVLTDSTFLIRAEVLINQPPDAFVITFGLSDSARTVAAANQTINKRIDAFKKELGSFGVKNAFVDLTAQVRVLDYRLDGRSTATQYLKGFEVKKNLIFRLKEVARLDDILVTAASHQIYDLVNVEYVIEDIGKVNQQLFAKAMEVINQKKNQYVQATAMKLLPGAQVYAEQYASTTPANRYREYQAKVSSLIQFDYSTNWVRKDLPGQSTFYYQPLDYSGYDAVLNPGIAEPGVACTLSLQVLYRLERGR